ncbi:hypothetical protein FQA39_LY06619 [Lamprigera yunnana]|nr:hypothetical protein FQA39_LY06619 [Lamprigera yunnana]
MADEDEIDILGDFSVSLDNLLSKNDSELYNNSGLGAHNSEIFNCDCPSEWCLGQHSSSCWYSNGQTEICSALNGVGVDYGDSQTSNENYSNDSSGWTDLEKDLLQKGIEIFDKSNTRLSQFIGTKTATEVKHFLKHYYVGNESLKVIPLEQSVIEDAMPTDNVIPIKEDSEILDASEIPASIEEVIAVVSTGKPTVSIHSKKIEKGHGTDHPDTHVNINDIASGQSLLKNNFYKNFKLTKKNGISKLSKPLKRRIALEAKFKFKTKMKILKNACSKKKLKVLKPATKITNKVDNRQNILDVNGEEVVKISKESSDEDIDLDVENDDFQQENFVEAKTKKNVTSLHENNVSSEVTESEIQRVSVRQEDKMEDSVQTFQSVDADNEVRKQLMNMDVPKGEVLLSKDIITDLERSVHTEFFEGRPTKTPSRYLKIRNHILNTWFMLKPTYVTKTSLRPALKDCGDVNCIGRIHNFLEQIGAINFGCVQTTYVRPLNDLILTNVPVTKEKGFKNNDTILCKSAVLSRPRIRKKVLHDGEGGYTLTHNENGDVINTTIVNEEPVVKQKHCIRNPTIKLIYCKAFTADQPQEFEIHLNVLTLLLMDFHAHTSLSEVMGLIGGYWNSEKKSLMIVCYIPCRNIASSATHCDMCPISQAKAADRIHSEGLNILGWFHSHPTFAPEPSQQDIDTQLAVQQWIGNDKPCIGLILSPFSVHGALISSPYRCLMVGKRINFEDQFVPFKFQVDVISSNLDIDYLLREAWNILTKDCNIPANNRVDFKSLYFLDQSMTYFDKFISSLKMHLAKCSEVNKNMCDEIINGFANICLNSAQNI